MSPHDDGHRALRYAMLATVLLSAVRVTAADRLGFGDSEALYASYAFYPQAVYLDHPGLIGLFARAIGDGAAARAQCAGVPAGGPDDPDPQRIRRGRDAW